MNLSFSDSGNKYTRSSLHDEKENVLAALAGLIQATDRVVLKSQDPNFSGARVCLTAIYQEIETTNAEATPKQTFNSR